MNQIIHLNAFILSNKMCTLKYFGMDFAVNFYAQGYRANDTLYLNFSLAKTFCIIDNGEMPIYKAIQFSY